VAFCDSAGDSTVDALGRRVCYCGTDMYKDSAGLCQMCAVGSARAVGGAASKNEVCDSGASYAPSASGGPSVYPSYMPSASGGPFSGASYAPSASGGPSFYPSYIPSDHLHPVRIPL
jgi:hypothetical protein